MMATLIEPIMVFFNFFIKYWTVLPLRQCSFLQIIPKFFILHQSFYVSSKLYVRNIENFLK